MRVVVIGLGSMGKRRIRLIRKYDKTIEIVGIDLSEERRKVCSKEFNIETFQNLGEIMSVYKINCAFICTSPLSHNELINRCLSEGINVFTELNLISEGYDANIALAKENNLVLFMSSTFLYREEIKKIKTLVKGSNCMLNYSYHIGQYLPDWHPWESYKDFFVGDKRTNGCREIFAIELPWLIDVFGEIEKVDVLKSKMSSLSIDYNDNYLVLLKHKSGYKGTLNIDVVSRKAVRNLEVFGEQLYLNWDGSPTGLNVYDYETKTDVNIQLYKEIDQLDNYSSFVVENAYSSEISCFFKVVTEGEIPIYNFEKDKYVLDIIDRIEG